MLGWRDFHRMKAREIAVQIGLVLLVLVIVIGSVRSAQVNLAALGITSGYSFLDRATGWSYSFSLLERSIDDPYARTLLIGFLNTIFVGSTSIVLATILGFAIGTMRDSRNLGLQVISSIYIQVFRNIPLILQVVFLYALLIHFPGPRQAHSIADAIFMSNRGIMVPVLSLPLSVVAGLVLGSVLLGIGAARLAGSARQARAVWLAGTAALFVAAALLLAPEGRDLVSYPELKGLRFVGGLTLSVELVAMIVGVVLYGAAYIGEVVRGGLAEVPKGLREAGESLGLGTFAVWWTIRMPMALRSIIPPLGNQWIFIMKATTVGVAIGFSDLFYIVSTSITQSGQTLELIAILMGAFLLVNFALAQAVNWLNARLALKGYGA
ncbi:MAG: ABC transporter permease subunit [Boseongicola sp. SB0664_bin_43]|uniref:ABC transporter permease subunit n=1 Tax=Boseongicola sp. SB0664_bin_43 TaxID=2604844 RepID=A0A6B0Y2Z3_9RHOB|nr:ABC transporter permease subunit [Boseongicola sp. SB0664_bin_43]